MSKRKVPGISSLIDTNIESVHVIVKKKKTDSQHESDNHEGEDQTLSPESDPAFQTEILENLSRIEQLVQMLTSNLVRNSKPIERRSYEEVLPSANCTSEILKLGVENMFPIGSIQELVDLEHATTKSSKVLQDLKDCVRLRRPGDGNVCGSLKLIISDQVLDEHNWSGAHGKRKLSATKLFRQILYETWFSDDMAYSEYVAEIQTAMKRVQKRVYKQRIRRVQEREIKQEGPFSCTTDDDYLDDARYKSVVLHKLANIRKLLQRAVSIHDKPSVPNNVAIGKRHFKTEPISHVDTTVVVREISEMGVMNFMPCTALQEIFDLEQSMRVDSQIYEDVVTYIRVRRPVEDNQLPSALRMICSDEVLYQFNWSGLNGRKRISDLVIFSKIIFEEWYKDRMTLADYINELKEALNKVHKRTHKKRTRWQRKKEEEGEYAD